MNFKRGLSAVVQLWPECFGHAFQHLCEWALGNGWSRSSAPCRGVFWHSGDPLALKDGVFPSKPRSLLQVNRHFNLSTSVTIGVKGVVVV